MKLQKNILKTARETLLIEAQAIEQIAEYLDEDFEKCALEILNSKGRLIVCGIGKSANIGNKMVATFNSTGTPSIFLHAADAIHGDLGMILEEDIVMCISKSGNTPEIKVLIPLLKRTGAKLVGLVGNVHSYLAENADFVLNATVEKEADPNDLAPTTSTTAALALGDALAVSLLHMRDFSKEDFARFHPGGVLGKQLYLKVEDLYKQNELPMVRSNASVAEVIMEITSKRLGATAVVDEDEELLGIITDGDIRRMLKNHTDLSEIKAGDIMTYDPKTIEEDEFAINALELMRNNNISQLVVVEGKQVVGFLHLHDLIKEGLV